MHPVLKVLVGSSVAAAGLVSACGDDHGSMNGTISRSWDESVLVSLAGREEAHHCSSVEASAPLALHAETARYVTDMDSLSDDWMSEMCGEMTGGGMMGGMHEGDMDSMHDAMVEMMDGMMDSVHAHHGRMDSLGSLPEMQEECERHYRGMMGMLEGMGWSEGREAEGRGEGGGSHDQHH